MMPFIISQDPILQKRGKPIGKSDFAAPEGLAPDGQLSAVDIPKIITT